MEIFTVCIHGVTVCRGFKGDLNRVRVIIIIIIIALYTGLGDGDRGKAVGVGVSGEGRGAMAEAASVQEKFARLQIIRRQSECQSHAVL